MQTLRYSSLVFSVILVINRQGQKKKKKKKIQSRDDGEATI